MKSKIIVSLFSLIIALSLFACGQGSPVTSIPATPTAGASSQNITYPTSTNAASFVASPSPMITPTSLPNGILFRDDFSGTFQPGWTWENEKPNRWTITQDGWLQILAEDESLFANNRQSNMLWRDLPEIRQFEIIAHLKAETSSDFQQAAIFIYQDAINYITINRGFCSPCAEGANSINMDYKIAGSWGNYHIPTEKTDVFLRLTTSGNSFEGFYATEPDKWQRIGRIGNYIQFKKVGLGVSNSDQAATNDDLVGLFDYFEIRDLTP